MQKGWSDLKVKCKANDCFYNVNGICVKDEINIEKVNAYDDNCAECVDYYIKPQKLKCWCCQNENVVKGQKCNNCGEIV